MKIDVVRKLPDNIDTLVLCHREDGKLDVFAEWISEAMYDSIKRFVEVEKITFKADEIATPAELLSSILIPDVKS